VARRHADQRHARQHRNRLGAQVRPVIDRTSPLIGCGPNNDPNHRPPRGGLSRGAPPTPVTISPVISALVPTARVVPKCQKTARLPCGRRRTNTNPFRAALEEVTIKRGGFRRGQKLWCTRLRRSRPAMALPAVQTAVPEARAAVGANASKLVVWARPADQEDDQGRAAGRDGPGRRSAPTAGLLPKVHAVHTADPAKRYWSLCKRCLPRGATCGCRWTQKPTRSSPLPRLRQARRDRQKVIAEIDRGSTIDSTAQMEIQSAAPTPIPTWCCKVLNNIVSKTIAAHVAVGGCQNPTVNCRRRLPPQHENIKATIERFASRQKRELEVFQLEVLEPADGRRAAIDRLLGEGTAGCQGERAPPTVENRRRGPAVCSCWATSEQLAANSRTAW